MKLWYRSVVVAALSATVSATCGGNKGLPGTHPDSGAAVSGNADPDGAVSLAPDAVSLASDTGKIDPGTGGVDGLPADTRDGGSISPGSALLTVSPPTVDVGLIIAGQRSLPVTVTVTNAGGATSNPLNLTVSGVAITATGCSGTILPPNAFCTITITASPSVPGPISGTIEVGDSPLNTKQIAVSGSADREGPYGLSVFPSPLDLGPVLIGQTVTGTIVLTSGAPVDLTGLVISVSGPGFSRSASGTCTDALPMRQPCNIDVSFTAGSTAGLAKGTVTVSQGGVTKTVALTALVQAPVPPIDLLPIDNTVPGWMIDAQSNLDGSKKPMTATTKDEGGALIDGGIEPYYADDFSPNLFIWQNYCNSHLLAAPVSENPKGATLMLFVFRMPSAAQASALYTNLLRFSEYTRKKTDTSSGWEEPTAPLIGSKSRIQDTGSDWFINFHKNEYYVEIKLDPSYGPAPDYTPGNLELKKEALRFAQEVAGKL